MPLMTDQFVVIKRFVMHAESCSTAKASEPESRSSQGTVATAGHKQTSKQILHRRTVQGSYLKSQTGKWPCVKLQTNLSILQGQFLLVVAQEPPQIGTIVHLQSMAETLLLLPLPLLASSVHGFAANHKQPS